MTVTTPAAEIPRDRFMRPLVTPPGGGKPVAYTRCTTFVDCIEDKFNLQKWMQRQVAIGIADRNDLRLAVNAHRDDNRQLDDICEQAKEAAASKAAATVGTALHSMTEQMDRGLTVDHVPVEYAPDLAAYTAATEPLQHEHIEAFCVQDPLRIGGTPDRIVKYQGKRYIADIKSGSIEYGALKIAMQLAVYARSQLYDIATGTRSRHHADIERGIIIHLPAGEGRAELVWVDLLEGWSGVRLAKQVREKRKIRFTDLTEPLVAPVQPTLADQVNTLTDADAIRALWAANAKDWNDDLTDRAKKRITALTQTPDATAPGK